jgi:hypothetical protein
MRSGRRFVTWSDENLSYSSNYIGITGVLQQASGYREGGEQRRSLLDIHEAARQVSTSLDALLTHVKTSPRHLKVSEQDQRLDTIITSSDRLISYQGSSSEMVRQAQVLAQV